MERRRGRPQYGAAGSFPCSGLGYTPRAMVWFTLFFLVILKIPALYLAYVIWWAVKDPPLESAGGPDGATGGGSGPSRHGPRLPVPGRRPGPHGKPTRRQPRVPDPAPLRAERPV